MKKIKHLLLLQWQILEWEKEDISLEQYMLYPLPEPLILYAIKRRLILRDMAEGLHISVNALIKEITKSDVGDFVNG